MSSRYLRTRSEEGDEETFLSLRETLDREVWRTETEERHSWNLESEQAEASRRGDELAGKWADSSGN